MAAETERIAQRRPYLPLLWLPEREVKPGIQFRVVGEMIDRWRDLIVNDTHDPGDRLDHPGCSETVSRHRFRGADIGGERMIAKDVNDRLNLRTIPQRGRRAMRIDIVDISGFHPGVSQ